MIDSFVTAWVVATVVLFAVLVLVTVAQRLVIGGQRLLSALRSTAERGAAAPRSDTASDLPQAA